MKDTEAGDDLLREMGYSEDSIKALRKPDLCGRIGYPNYELIRGISYKTLPDKKKLVKWYNRLESDTSRYQALGNSLAIPCALRVIGGIVDYMTGGNYDNSK